MSKNFLSLLLIGIIIGELLIFGISNAKIGCGSSEGFALYKCRVDDICKKYYNGPKKEIIDQTKKDKEYDETDSKISDSTGRQVYKTIRYLEPESYYKNKKLIKEYNSYHYEHIPFLLATKTYKENMNGIYKCAILYARRKSLKEIEKLLIEETTGEVAKKTEKRIKHDIKEINKLLSYQIKEKDKINFISNCRAGVPYEEISKRNILKEVTYETCKFRTYMEFLKDFYKLKVKNIVRLPKGEKIQAIQGSDMGYKYNEILTKIETQIDHSYLVFNRAYEEYTAYESNYMLHIMLVFLRDNFIVVRAKVHNVLTPMNQVVYKIANAMIQQ